MGISEALIEGQAQGVLVAAERPNGLGVIVLTGSSGRVDVARARLFAELGAAAFAQRWWGGEGQAAGVNEIPIETVLRGVDLLLAEGCERIAILGTSFGAGAALLAAVYDPRVDVCIAISPTAVVWQNSGPSADGSAWPPRSQFTWEGRPLPFVVLDPRPWPPAGTPNPSYRRMHEQSLRTFAEDVPAATIPVERARADLILVAGGADALWPSDTAAREIAGRLARNGRQAVLIEHPHAGHCPVFPGEAWRAAPPERAWGGGEAADRALGALAWDAIVEVLGLGRAASL